VKIFEQCPKMMMSANRPRVISINPEIKLKYF
jgi:hypothetical protein